MRSSFSFILILIVLGCNGTKQITGLSELQIENRKSNNLIINRKPDYRFDGGDGDVLLAQISMDIIAISEKQINGKVFDAKTKEPISGAYIWLMIKGGGIPDTISIIADPQGTFESHLTGQLDEIKVHAIAYRDLKIKLKQ